MFFSIRRNCYEKVCCKKNRIVSSRVNKTTASRKRRITASYEDIEDLTWDEKIDYLIENDYNTHSYDDMKDFAIQCVRDDNLYLAIHILDAINSDPGDFYHYDYTMGTMETPTSISDEDDIESVIDLYE